MKPLILLPSILFIASFLSIKAENKIIWETLGNFADSEKESHYVQQFTIFSDEPIDGFAFCQLKRKMKTVSPEDSVIEILPGYYYVTSPRFNDLGSSDSIIVQLRTNTMLINHLFLPDGMHFVKEGKPIPVKSERKRLTSFPNQWINPLNGKDYMIYGDSAYRANALLLTGKRPEPYLQIPTPKKVESKDKKVTASHVVKNISINKVKDPRHDYWYAEIKEDGIILNTNSLYPQVIVENLIRRLIESRDSEGKIFLANIEDWSDYAYRGFMLDVARNFLPKENVKKVIDLMSRYGLNILHFHLGEDEGWRLELPSLPELTEVGAHRGFTLTDDVPFLKGIYSGDGNPYSNTVANGYYSIDDFIDIIKYAEKKGVLVIPEFDTPGHSRAAIRAMEWRARTTSDKSLRLIEDGDTSKYTTAQDLHDNLMNPALDGPYKFWDLVFNDVIKIYGNAGVPLVAINIGGDEVPIHAWDGSPSAITLMKEKGMKDQKELHAYFVDRVANIAADKGIKIAGWQELALDHSLEYDQRVAPAAAAVNSWTYAGDKSKKMVEKGYNVVLSNVDYLYFDQHYTGHPEEPGMWWGGMVDEFKPLHATIETLMPADTILQKKVHGISAHIFSETIRDFDMVTRYMLPRILGLAERAHNAHTTISDEEYFGALTQEMQRWNEENLNFYVRQPGIIIEEGMILMNEPYGFGEIRYTIDGNEPQRNSTLYQSPIKLDNIKEIRAKLYIGNSSSSTSILQTCQN